MGRSTIHVMLHGYLDFSNDINKCLISNLMKNAEIKDEQRTIIQWTKSERKKSQRTVICETCLEIFLLMVV
jgi:hypothetical protein